MADKFVITGELELALASGVTAKIEELKKRVKGSGITLPVDIDTSSVTQKLKAISVTGGINLDVAGLQADVKTILREFNGLETSITKKPLLGKINIDLAGLQADVKSALQEFRGLRTSLTNQPIVGSVGFDIGGLQVAIKTILQEARGLKTSLNAQPISLNLQIANNNAFEAFVNSIKNVKSKSISVGINVKDKSIDKLKALSVSLDNFNIAVNLVDTARLFSITDSINSLGKAVGILSKFSGKKFAFDISLRDVKNTQILENALSGIAKGFNRATQSGNSFNNMLKVLSGVLATVRTNLNSLDFSKINAGATSLKSLASTNIAQAQKNITSSVKGTNSAIYDLGVQSAITLKRFGAYTLVTAGFFRLTYAIRNALTEFIAFDQELVKVRQVTGQSKEATKALGDEVGRLATIYGVSSQSILNTSLVLAQAGYNTNETKKALEALAKTEVAPTFDNIESTVEGSIAAMAQFGFGVDELDSKLSAINSVSAAFAIESQDITTAVQKAGGSFAAAGGSLEELIALLTSVRATTRESADTISTGFRTIFTRLQRVSTGKYLENLGIQIRKTGEDVAKTGGQIGDFVGPFEAIKRLSDATSQLSTKDPRFAQIVEELGGFRQINKVIPLLQSQSLAQNALSVAIGNTNSLSEDAVIAGESYANQLTKVKEEFLLLIREIADDKSIKQLVTNLLQLTTAGIEVGKTFKSLVPLIAGFGLLKLGGFAKQFTPGFKDGIKGLNSGGVVPGRGPNKDSVLTYLTKGEYVLNRDATDKLGVSNLDNVNRKAQRLNSGGIVGGGATKNSGIAGVAGFAGGIALLYSGLGESFNKLDDQTKQLYSSVIGNVGLFLLLKNATQTYGEAIKKATASLARFPEVIREATNVIPGLKKLNEPEKAPGKDPKINYDKSIDQQKFEQKAINTTRNFKENKKGADQTNQKILDQMKENNSLTKGLSGVSDPKVLNNAKDSQLYKRIPEDIRKSLESAGVTLTRANKVTDALPQLKGVNISQDPKRGTFDNQPGAYDRKNKKVVLAKNKKNQKNNAEVFFHEYGHAFDDTIGGSNDSGFKKAYEQDVKNLPKDKRSKLGNFLQSGEKGRRETFAQGFGSVITNGKGGGDFGKNFPQVTKFLSELVGPTVQDKINPKLEAGKQKLSTLIAPRSVQEYKAQNAAEQQGVLGGQLAAKRQAETTARISDRLGIPPGGPNDPDYPGRRGFTGMFGGGGPRGPGSPGGPNNPDKPSRFGKFKVPKISAGVGQGLGVGLGLAGSFVGESLKGSSRVSENNKGNREQFAIGGALSTGATGATTGALIGSLIAPGIGTAIGGALGGVGGAAYGAINSLKEFDNAIQSIEIGKLSQNLDEVFDSITNKKSTNESSRSNVLSTLSGFQDKLQSTSDQGSRDDLIASLKSSSLNIQNFVTDIAKGSISIEEFSKKVDDESLSFIAGIVGVPLDKYKSNIEDAIKQNIELESSLSRLTNSTNAFDDRVRSISRFNSAFDTAINSVNSFSNNLESFAFSGGGSTKLVDRVTPALSNLDNGLQNRELTARVSSFANQFGDSGRKVGDTVNDVAQAKSVIPDILLQLRSQAPLASEGDLETRLSDLLEKNNVGPEIANLLNARLESLLGDDFKDSEFFKSLEKDMPKAISDLTAGLEAPVESLSKTYKIADGKLGEFASRLEKLRNIDKSILDGALNISDLKGGAISSRQSFLPGSDFSSQLLANAQDKTRTATGGRTSGELSAIIAASRNNINNLTSQADSTEDVSAKAGIINALELERSAIDRATESLNYLSKNTNELSVLQSKLTREQEARLSKKDIAKNLTFGDANERAKFSRVNSAAQNLATSGSISSVPQDIIKDVLGLLEQMSSSEIGSSGLTGREVIDQTIRNSSGSLPIGFQNTVDPGAKEQNLQTQIEAQISAQISAQQTLNDILAKDRQSLSSVIQGDMGNFLTELKVLLEQGFVKDTKTQIQTSTTKRDQLEKQAGTIAEIKSKYGENAINNAAGIQQNQKDLLEFQNKKPLVEQAKKSLESAPLAFQQRGSLEDISKFTSKAFANLDPKDRNRVFEDLGKKDIGRNVSDNTVDVNKTFQVIQDALNNIIKDAEIGSAKANSTKEGLIKNVGSKNFSNIAKGNNAQEIIDLSKNLPKDQNIADLNKEIAVLNTTINNLTASLPASASGPAPIKRNSGGVVPGTGNSDTVRALLTPGEVVMNKAAVKSYGMANLLNMNRSPQKFAEGGMVKKDDLGSFFDSEKLPKTILSSLRSNNVTLKKADSLTDIDSSLRFQKPRGVDTDFSNIQGLYRDSSKEIFLRNDAKPQVLTHEIGHAFDYSQNKITDSKEYLVAYKRDVSKLSQEQKEKFKYLLQEGVAGRRESFAEIFNSVLRNSSSSASVFPESTKLVNNKIKESEISNFSKDWKEIHAMRNMANPDWNSLLAKIKESKEEIASSLVQDDPRVQKFLSQLNIAEGLYSKKLNGQTPIARNLGGIVPGSGNLDTVKALLTPGEIVMNKSAVKKYGASNLLNMNKGAQKFADGGMVQPNSISIDGESLSKFNFAVSQLAIQITNMKDAFAALPSSITMNGSFRLDVYINGTQAFASMTDSFRSLVQAEISKGINNLLKKKFPNLGTFDA